MNFGDILEKWEKQTPGNTIYYKDEGNLGLSFRRASYPGPDGPRRFAAAERRNRLLRKKPDASVDLHGFDSGEAWAALQIFFEESLSKGLEKVLIIHGKGNHWNGEGVLRDLSRRFIESCSYAGESGHCRAKDGGTGATWVILKERNSNSCED